MSPEPEDAQLKAVSCRNVPCFSEGAQLAAEGAQVEDAQVPRHRGGEFSVFQRRCATGDRSGAGGRCPVSAGNRGGKFTAFQRRRATRGRRGAGRRCAVPGQSWGRIHRVSAKVRNWRPKGRRPKVPSFRGQPGWQIRRISAKVRNWRRRGAARRCAGSTAIEAAKFAVFQRRCATVTRH
jgi:hypothetical protein